MTPMPSLVPLALCLTLLPGTIAEIRAGQSSPATSQEATGTITGRVIIENQGAAGVAVVLQKATGSSPMPVIARAITDKEGQFKMTNLAEGRYYLVSLAQGYFTPSDDRMIASGKSITLLKGEELEGIELSLTPGGVITGRVTTANGNPVIGRIVYPLLVGLKTYQFPSPNYDSSRFRTDDRGVYRIFGLPSGRYIVSVESDIAGNNTETFNPGVAEISQATPIDVTAGNVTENVDIKLLPITRGYEVSGRLVDEATGHPIPKIQVNCITRNKNRYHRGSPPVNERGEFHFTDLLPGRYALFVPIYSLSEYYSDEVVFEVTDHDLTGLEIKARRAASLSGMVVIEGAQDPDIISDLSHLEISLNPIAGGFGTRVQAGADGRFRIPGLPPNKFRLSISSKTERQRFRLLGVEREGLWQGDEIEVRDREQVTGLLVKVSYATAILRGQVQVVGGSLPEKIRFQVLARRLDIRGRRISTPEAIVEGRGRFLLEGLTPGQHEITLTPFIPLPSGGMQFGGWPSIKQTISVTSGTESQITLIYDLDSLNAKGQKR
jgi:hypothetical protein